MECGAGHEEGCFEGKAGEGKVYGHKRRAQDCNNKTRLSWWKLDCFLEHSSQLKNLKQRLLLSPLFTYHFQYQVFVRKYARIQELHEHQLLPSR